MLKLKLKPEPGSEKPSSPTPGEKAPGGNGLKLNLNMDKPGSNPVRIRLRTNKSVEGYDVEAPDREEDPTVEEAIVLRMLPGVPALAKMQQACDTGDFSKIQIKFEDRRHAIVSVDGEDFFARLMDLPTITEVHKTLDRRNVFKTVDVSQILLVTHKSGNPAPDLSEYTQFSEDPQVFPHGLTPPLFNVRNRRFQKRMSTKAVESLEAQVEELLQKDAAAKEVTTELLPASAIAAQQALAEAARAAAQSRADESDDMEVDELDEELERAMLDGEEEAEDDDDEPDGQAGSGSDDDDDDDDDDRPAGERDDDEEDARHHNKQLREEIKELQATIEAKEKVAGTVVNDIMRARHMDAVTRLRTELEKKQSLLGEADQKQGSADFEEENDFDAEDDDDDDDDEGGPEGPDLLDMPAATQGQQQAQSSPAPETGANGGNAAPQPASEDDVDRQLQAQLGNQLGDVMQDEEDDIDSLF